MTLEINKIHFGNALSLLRQLPDNYVHCGVTSPPYYGLRDYGTLDQIGLEETPEMYVAALVAVFTEFRRVLRDDGTLWLNLGDSYARAPQNETDVEKNGGFHSRNGTIETCATARNKRQIPSGLKQKDLIGIPWMVAFALRSAGWYLRQDIIWHKPNPMPESVTDRCTKSHEYIFLLSKSAQYYYDHEAIKQVMAESSFNRLTQNIDLQKGSERVPGKTNGAMKAVGQFVGGKKHKNVEYNGQKNNSFHKTRNDNGQEWQNSDGLANKRSVWTVTTKPYTDAHFATFPQELIVDCIKAGCPIGGIVLDPFMGAGTTAVVARKLNRNFIGFELNQDYIDIANKRLYAELGMYL